jgi:serine protease Do
MLRNRSRLPTILLAALLLVAMVAMAAPAAAGSDAPKPLTSRRLFDQSRPGVELIRVDMSAGLVVPEPTVTPANGQALESIVADKIRRGKVPATQTAARGAIIEEMARDPFRWFTASSKVHRAKVKLTATGSGFSIAPNGYIVTNAHVVALKDDDLKAAFLAKDFSEGGDEIVANVRAEGLTQSQATKFLTAIVRWATRMTMLANFRRTIAVLGSTGSGSTSSSKRRVAKLIDAGEEFPGKDVALIKVAARNMATVPLGDDTALGTGDRLFVLGFPGAATFNPALSKASQGEPTLTQGVLSAKKQVNKGYTVLQTDAEMTHGNSGGPVFDEQGKVVGVATVGSVDPNTGRELSGLNFAVPASIVNELLRKAHVTATEGEAGSAYRQALDAIDKQWYKRSLPLLDRVKALDPGHPLAAKLIKDSQTAIDQGRDRTPAEILGLPVVIVASAAGVVVVVGILAGVLGLRSRRRRRREQRGRHEPDPGPAVARMGWPTEPTGWDAPPVAPVAPVAPAAEDAYGYSSNGWSPPAAEQQGTTAAQSWWETEGAQTEEFARAQPAQPLPQPAQPLPQPAQPLPQPSQPLPQPSRSVAQPSRSLVCPSCGQHNHPSLRYCEQCWTVLG